jgi:outer membrane protein assembly factor BamB
VPLLNGDLAALDATTGREIWRVRNADPKLGATLAAAPLVVEDLVIAGVSGAEYGVRGYLTAYDAMTGRLVWRGYSTGPDADVLIDGPPTSTTSRIRAAIWACPPGGARDGGRAAAPHPGGFHTIPTSS